MAKTILNGHYLPASGGTSTLHTAAGRLLAVLISHTAAAANVTVKFYDATAATPGTEIAVINVNQTQSPFFLRLERDAGIPFTTGLHVDPSTADVNVWSVDHG